ncbi:oxidoreductase [Micromonospora humidisoli]|uniref:SDR family NAD(P)-dependent oxidoreductase n=1 Tax=Micromonospora humidisoli TaxID=2807622 RepID=A0ABS2JE13_9ACTN|nr:oxidoreductase [Micromonospora humidisoli]MBM7084733.1 SDR family NAD(P)-dependent oxidoreductase [Micromonospora humidisoli]
MTPSLAGRTVVITGANSGIGRATARTLAARGARVVLAVRDLGRGRAAAADLPGRAEVRRLDLADLSSVRAFAAAWTEPVDVLINNAGVMMPPPGLTVDGFEPHFGINHLGHFALTNLLLPRITGRVVTVSAGGHQAGTLDLDDPHWRSRPYRPFSAYAQSKLANLLFTAELQRRLTASGSAVLATAANPGLAATNLLSHGGSRAVRWTNALLRPLSQSDAGGARTTVHAATADLPGNSYISPRGVTQSRGRPRVTTPSKAARDPERARQLWILSENMTATTFPLPRSPHLAA